MARRDMLLASGMVMAAAATPSCAQQPSRAASLATTVEGVSAKAMGAIADGQFHPLSERFKTLAEACAVYAFAERLDQSLDWAGIQAAVDAVEAARGTAVLPVGHYVISNSIQLPSWVTLRGEGRNGTLIDNQYHGLKAPQIVNKDPIAFLYVTIRDLSLHGGTHAIKVNTSREVAGIVIEGVTTNLQTEANITFSSMQTTVIRDCHLMDGRHGVAVDGFPCNSVHLENTRLGRHTGASIRLRGADGVVMQGGSIEAGGGPGLATIDIETGGAYANAIHFQNVYFENTHQFLLRSRATRTVSFQGCKITGTGAMGRGMGPYQFDCGDDLIVFDDNHWDLATGGPANMLVQGRNDGLVGLGNVWSVRHGRAAKLQSRRFTLAEVQRGLFQLDFGGKAGRAYGKVEFFLDGGTGRPLRRATLPIDVALDADGGVVRPPMAAGSIQLAVAGADGKARIAARLGSDLTGYQRLWFELDLAADTAGAMSVGVL